VNFILFNVWTPSEMTNAQALLLANGKALDDAVNSCATLDSNMADGWKQFFSQLTGFAQQKPVLMAPIGSDEVATTGTRADLLQNYQAELTAWQKLIGGKCKLSLPDFAPPPTGAATQQTFKYIAVAGGFIASAWLAHEVVKGIGLFRKAPV
jgi:hypothetical protein